MKGGEEAKWRLPQQQGTQKGPDNDAKSVNTPHLAQHCNSTSKIFPPHAVFCHQTQQNGIRRKRVQVEQANMTEEVCFGK